MCTELQPQQPTDTAPGSASGGLVSRRTALLASVGLTASTMLTVSGTLPAAADGRHGDHGGRHGKLDLTYTLGEDFPAYAPEKPPAAPGLGQAWVGLPWRWPRRSAA